MIKRSIPAILFITLLLVSTSEAATIYVGAAGDPYQVIQDAIDAAASGDTIIVPSGTYIEALTINRRLTIQSQTGPGQTIVQSPSTGSYRVFDVSASGVTIRGFSVRNGERGISLSQVSNCSVANNTFSGNTYAIHAGQSTAIITDNQFSANRYGIYFYASAGTIANNTISNHNEYGIGISNAGNSWIEANTLSANKNGIWFDNTGNSTVTGNHLSANGIGVNLWNSSGITVTSNTITANGLCGINLFQSSNNQISSNTVTQHTNSNYAGIFLHDQSYQNTVGSNTVSHNSIGIAVLSNSNTIDGNILDQNYWYAIKVTSGHNTLSGNTLSNGNETGLYLHHATSNSITGNTAFGNDDGILLDSSSGSNTLSGNTLRNNSNSGVTLNGCSQNTVSGNTLESNTNFGINVDQANSNTIAGNIVQSNGLCGVQLYFCSGNTIYNNIIRSNAQNGCDNSDSNFWSVGKQAGGNIIGGPYLGGNSWSDYPGRDSDGDGLGDTFLPHTASGSILYGGDEYPLVPVETVSPPAMPSSPTPVSGAIYQSIDAILSWQGGDPDPGDTVSYDVYLGTTFPLPAVSLDQAINSFNPGGLIDRVTYFWQVIARDDLFLITPGPTWRFTIDSSVVGSYLFEAESDILADASGNDQNGTVYGASFATGQGVMGSNAFRFDWSTSDTIRIPFDSSQSAVQALTLEAWIYPTAWDNTAYGLNRIVSKQPVYLLRGQSNGHAHFQILTQTYGYAGVYDSQVMTLNRWHHVVGTFDGQIVNLYVDGRLRQAHHLASPDLIADNTADICIGEYPVLAEGFSGLIDNVTILKRAKTAAEVAASYTAIANPCEGDLNGDKLVDGQDLFILADEFNRIDCSQVDDCLGDTNGDGVVDDVDLSVFAVDFGRVGCQ